MADRRSNLLKTLPPQHFVGLAKEVAALEQAGADIIRLGQGTPDLPTPKPICEALETALANPETHQYGPFRGQSRLKQAVSTFYLNEYGVDVDAETEVAILIGSKSGLITLPQCVLEPGEGILLPNPGYPDYISGARLAGSVVHDLVLTEDNDFLPDYKTLDTHGARLMYLNYPSNPTGAVATPQFFEDTVRFAREQELMVVHDFAYGSIGFDGHVPPSFLQADGAKEVGIEVYTMSKAFNMSGWRVAFAVGNKDIIEAINTYQDHVHVSVFSAIQEAAVAALESPKSIRDDLSRLYETRRDRLVDGLRQAGWDVTAPKGSFFVWARVPEGDSASFAKKLLHEAGVAVTPGYFFGTEGERYVRFGLVSPEPKIDEAVERIERLFAAYEEVRA
ncbi:aminotransferase class I/II-fold pyridoxal phosphate-dependent enzyme [Exiguobacterium alkaliphilum]|uniref:Aminotransferase class I/II-fold pyridoxal phosphate-dependent enzyme n=1 Tax=Exiguobacterium alkaliphilum TaxID=1428684 RepID=A0ABT2KVN1_9BACL|nr:aminotransferase class I/II-fold pyridoxal phosphate-dependent enzyme [Exiguobacterium alkaliphilum]MCT4795002.1 aminotransferase class I/II-fold pyridoxal phosphate-dependent enzyme [Exiguobacterium alkaliphilum]